MPTETATTKRRIGELLLESGLVTRAELEEALRRQQESGEKLVTILISMGALDTRDFVQFLAGPDTHKHVEIGRFQIDPAVIDLVPKNFALMHEVIPIDRIRNTVTVASVRPLDAETQHALEEHTGCRTKTVLCSPDDIRAALLRHYEPEKLRDEGTLGVLEAPLRLTTVASMLRHIESLPGLPGTVHRVRELIYDEEGSAAEVASAVSRDPSIAAKLLRVANSAAYGFANRVDNVQLAVSLLGMVETYSVVVSTAVINTFKGSPAFNYMNFWLESMVCASFSAALARSFHARKQSGVFAAGLLHDLGRVALAEVAPKHYAKVDMALTGLALVKEEEEILGITHTEAGYQLAEHWGLPQELCEAMRFHHLPSMARPEFRTIVAIVNIADCVSRAHRSDSESREPDLAECRESLQHLEAAEEDVIKVFNSLPDLEEGDSLWSAK